MSNDQPDNRDERQKRLDERLAAFRLSMQALSRELRESRERMEQADRLERWRVRSLKAFDEYLGRPGPPVAPAEEP